MARSDQSGFFIYSEYILNKFYIFATIIILTMNYKCKLHAKVIVSPKEFPNQVFSLEMMLDSKLQFPPGFIESKKEKISSMSTGLDLGFDSVLKASLENMYPDFNVDFEIYHSELNEDKLEGNAIDDNANGNDL